MLGHPRVPVEIVALLMMAIVTFGGSTLVSANTRYLVPLVPLFSLWIVIVFSRAIEIRILPRQQPISEAAGVFPARARVAWYHRMRTSNRP